MFVNDKCVKLFLICDSTDYEFSATTFIALSRFYHFHGILDNVDRRENSKTLVVYGFHS